MKLQTWAVVMSLGVTGAALAQSETAPQQDTQQQDAQQQDTQATPQGSPAPSTSPTEGTAADTTPPGETQTQDSQRSPTVDPRPATDVGEGTAADVTPPGETETDASSGRTAAAGTAQGHQRASKIIGMKVKTPSGESLGEVEDIILDDSGKVSQVLVNRSQTAGDESRPASSRLAALPWTEVSSMIRADSLVIEREKLASAQSFDESRMR
jgi:sporulation protein YlmC with PRC-barrel domain